MKYKFLVPYFITTTAFMLNPNTAGLNAENNVDNYNKLNTELLNADKDSLATALQDSVPEQSAPQVTGISTRGKSVIYAYNDGSYIERKADGTRAWRNNNPGNLRYYQFAKDHGAVGEAGGFAVFPDEESGMAALEALLRTQSYQHLTVQQAIKRYAVEDVQRYLAKLQKLTGITPHQMVKNLSQKQMMALSQAIRQIEGWKPGTEKTIPGNDFTVNRPKANNIMLGRAMQRERA